MFVLTVNSRYRAQEGGQQELEHRVDALESLRDRALGAYALVVVLGVGGIVGGIVALVKIIKGP